MYKLIFTLFFSWIAFSAYSEENIPPNSQDLLPTALSKEQLESMRVPVIVSAEIKAKLASPLTGFIDKIQVKAGSTFHEGDSLVLFDCTVLKAEKEEARVEMDTLQKRSKGLDRLLRLDGANQMDVDEAKGKYLGAVQKLAVKSYLVDKCDLKAPFEGQVVSINVSAHEYIEQGKPILEAVSLKQLELSLILPSDWLSWMRIGSEFSVQLNETPGVYQAKINRFVYSIDPVSKTITAFGTFVEPNDNIKPGMSGNAQFKR